MAEVTIRSYTSDDFPALRAVQRECFPPPFPSDLWWNREQIAEHTLRFPEGALCAEIAGTIVGSATAHIVTIDPDHPQHTWDAITDHGYLRNHQPHGDSLYGVDIAVKPAFRGRGIARALYQARYALVRQLGLRRFVAGSRISGYHRHRDRLSPEAYVEALCAGELSDPVITPQMRAGLRPLHLLRDYIVDEEAANYALFMEWTPS